MPLSDDDWNFAAQNTPRPGVIAAQAATANPDKAAESYNLSKSTGVPASVIENDPKFQARLKAQSASAIVNANPQLRQYVTGNPSAAKVSSDDLGQLDTVSKSVTDFFQPERKFWSMLSSSAAGGSGLNRQAAGLVNLAVQGEKINQGLNRFAGGIGDLFNVVGDVASGKASMADPDTQGRAMGLAMLVAGKEAPGGAEGIPTLARAAAEAAPYVDAGKPVPVGADPLLDSVKKEESNTDLDNLKTAFKESLKSTTRERAPDLYRDFLAQHVGEESVGVSAETVAALYGGKTPEAGDNLLGFVPDIGSQYLQAMVTGSDIQVPIADMMTYMDPEVFKAIEPGIRPKADGFTKYQEPYKGQALLETPSAINVSKVQGRQYAEAIQKQQKALYDAALAKAQKEEAKRQTPEWRANEKDMRQEVIDDVGAQPKFLADHYIRSGQMPKIDGNALSPEQKAGLPRMYWSATEGRLPDTLAHFTGHESGDDLVNDLVRLHANRAGVAPEKYIKDLVDRETTARMEEKYGKLGENILNLAHEQTLAQTNLDVMHAELEYLAAEHGYAMPYSKETLLAQAKNNLGQRRIGQIDKASFLASAARASNRIEAALLNEVPITAFAARQEKWASLVYAKEAARIEKLKDRFDRIISRYAKMSADSIPETYSKEWVNQLHSVMAQFGLMGARRSVQNIAESMRMDGFKDLDTFVQKHTWSQDGFATRDIPVPEWLDSSQAPRTVDKMSGNEFEEFHAMISALDKGAREAGKIEYKGEKVDFQQHRDDLIKEMATARLRYSDVPKRPLKEKVGLISHAKAAMVNLETLFNRLDDWIPGKFFNTFTRQFSDAAAYEDQLLRDFQTKLHDALGDYKLDLDKKMPDAPWVDPSTTLPMKMTRRKVLGALANAGNESNLFKLAKGYGMEPQHVLDWLHTVTKPEDWQVMERIGKVWNEIFDMANTVHHNLTGVAVDRVPLNDIATPHGTYKGWYYPLMADGARLGYAKSPLENLGTWGEDFDSGFYRATTQQGWSKTRTGAIYPVRLDLDALPIRMKQMVHDIATRPAAIQISKFFYDNKFKQAFKEHVGQEYEAQLLPFLRDWIGATNYRSQSEGVWSRFMGTLTSNMVSTYIGLNIGTVLKHGTTAWANSISERGVAGYHRELFNLLKTDEATGDRMWTAGREKFIELSRRMTNFQQMLRNSGAEITMEGEQGPLNSVRKFTQWIGSAPVAGLDLLSAVPTAWDAYKEAIAAGEDEGTAVAYANRAVRLSHGSSVITNKPQVMRARSGFIKPFIPLMGFFSHIFQKQFELASRIQEDGHLLLGKEFSAAAARAPKIAGMFMSYIIIPAVIEQMVTPYVDPTGNHEAWGTKAIKTIAGGMMSSVVGARDIAHAIINHREPTVGIFGDMAKTLTDVPEDLMRPDAFTPLRRGKIIRDSIVLSGLTMGIGNTTMANAAKYTTDYLNNLEHPQGPWQWMQGIRYGTNKGHTRTASEYADWLRGQIGTK